MQSSSNLRKNLLSQTELNGNSQVFLDDKRFPIVISIEKHTISKQPYTHIFTEINFRINGAKILFEIFCSDKISMLFDSCHFQLTK